MIAVISPGLKGFPIMSLGEVLPVLSFPFAYSCHQLCIGSCFGPHVLVLGKVYEDTEDAGGDVKG